MRVKARYAAKRGGGRQRALDTGADPAAHGDADASELIEVVGRTLAELEAHDPVMAEVVLLCDVREWTMDRVASVTGIAKRTLERRRAEAHQWLRRHPEFGSLT